MTANLSPAEFIRDEMNTRGWSVTDLAQALDCHEEYAEHILAGKRITGRDAEALAWAFGTSEELWINLQAAWDRHNRTR